MVGEILNGRYEVLKPIGFGGMAEVYLARDVLLDRKVAIKILRKEYVNDKAQMAQFMREAKSAARLIHPSIINIYDVCEDKDLNYIVMEYVEGITLKAFEEQNGRLDPGLAVALTAQLASALEHAHSHNIIHCDIKPQNIVLTENMQPKIVDFGISKIVSNETMAFTASVVGSVHYFSPEQAQGLKITAQSDIYSLGIVFYEMLTGHVPFDGSTAVAVARKQIEELPPPLTEYWPAAPAQLQHIIDKSLAKKLDERYQTASEMRHDLMQAKKQLYPGGEHSYLDDTLPLEKVTAASAAVHRADDEPAEEPDDEKTLIMRLPSFLTKEVDEEGNEIPEEAEQPREEPEAEPAERERRAHRFTAPEPEEEEAGDGEDVPAPDNRKHKKAGFFARHPRLKKVLMGVLAVFIVLFAGCLYYFNSTTPELEVPDVNGMPVAEAQKVLEEKGFRVELEESMDKDATPGTVLKMDPVAGTKRKEGAKITLTIARGLDYYTGTVYETVMLDHPEVGSICSGGRYDNLAEYYTDKQLPGVGISIGLTRLFSVLEAQGYLNDALVTAPADVLILPMTEELSPAISFATALRDAGVRAQLHCEKKKFKQKLSYADKLSIPYAAFLGEDEIQQNKVTVKDLTTGQQQTVTAGEAVALVQAGLAARAGGTPIQEPEA